MSNAEWVEVEKRESGELVITIQPDAMDRFENLMSEVKKTIYSNPRYGGVSPELEAARRTLAGITIAYEEALDMPQMSWSEFLQLMDEGGDSNE